MNTSKVDLVQAGYLLLGIVILCIAAWWWHSTPASAPVGMATPATIAKEVKNVPTETIQPKKLVVYKQQAAANLGQSVADWVKNDMRIAAATSVKEDTHPQTIVTAVDTTTGKVETRVVREGYPWLAALQTGEVGVLYGSANGAPQTRDRKSVV